MFKNIFPLFIFFVIFTSCEPKEDPINTDQIIVTGKVHQFDGENVELFLIYAQPGMKRERVPIELDSLGKFKFGMKGSIPLDAMILDKRTLTNINFIYHPGDSINIQFSANDDPLSLLKTVNFTGDRKETNNDLIVFQRLREENKLGYDVIDPSVAYRLDVKDFTLKMDTVKQKQLKLYNQYITEFSPNNEVKQWTRQYALQTYYYFLEDYALDDQASVKKNIPRDYFNYNKEILPLSREKLVGWIILNSRINSYWRNNVEKNIETVLSDNIKEIKKIDTDSLVIQYVNSNVQDRLLSELLIASYFTTLLGSNIVDGYKKHEMALEEIIKTPLITDNLKKHYATAYDFINKPNVYTNEVLKKMDGTPIKDTFSKILAENEGKVLYIDCWATWCGPCLKAMPDSKKMIKEYQDEEVAFIYVCIESDEDLWKRTISELNLGGGQHYLLNTEQSSYFREALDIQGIPEYILIDKNKNIVEKGNHIYPGGELTKEKMKELLN